MSKRKSNIYIIIIIGSFFVSPAFAYKTDVHEVISLHASIKSNNLRDAMIDVGLLKFDQPVDESMLFSNNLSWWIQHGSVWEDDMGYKIYDPLLPNGVLYNHFYNPLNNQGYTDNSGDIKGQSIIERFHDGYNDWSYEMLRKLYYTALTGDTSAIVKDKMWDGLSWFGTPVNHGVNINQEGREQFFAWTLQALGHTIHLIQDASVPAHTRNDLHGFGFPGAYEPYEDWTSKNLEDLTDGKYFSKPGSDSWAYWKQSPNPLAPNNFIDSEQLDETSTSPIVGDNQGLAEYSHANFVSNDTIGRFNLPVIPHRNDWIRDYTSGDYTLETRDISGKTLTFVYLKNQSIGVDHLMLAGVFHHKDIGGTWPISWPDTRFTINDDFVSEDYAAKLIPRAVGYSAGFLDYFFRGKIDIDNPKITLDANSSIIGLSFSMKNVTPPLDTTQTAESFSTGNIELVYSYLPQNSDVRVYRRYHETNAPDKTSIYNILSAADNINTDYVPITISLPESVPAGAAEFTITLVFKGKLGEEDGAVAAKMYKFDNSRLAYHFQAGGQPNPSNIFSVSPDGSESYQLTDTSEVASWYFSPAWSRNGERMAFENHYCTEVGSDGWCAMENYFRNIVVVDLLSESKYPDNVLYEFNFDGAPLAGPAFSSDGTKIAAVMQNTGGFAYYCHVVVHDLETSSNVILNPEDDPNLTDLAGSGVAWSPTENKVVYYLNRQYNQETNSMEFEGDLILVNSDGTGKVRLTDDDFLNTQPSWSPDGEWIVFSSDRDGEESIDIWVMDKNGENPSKVVECSPANCFGPSYSPDGRKIAFSTNSRIYTINSNGDFSTLQEVANLGLRVDGLSWSPYLPPPSLEVESTDLSIQLGQGTTISWQTSRATKVTVDGVAETQVANGSINVFPDTTTTYTLAAVGPSGEIKKTITINVLQ